MMKYVSNLIAAAAVMALLLSVTEAVSVARQLQSGVPPCESEANKGAKFCDLTLGINERVADLVERIGVGDDAAALLGNSAMETLSPYLPAYQWWNEGLHGIANSPGVHYWGNVTSNTVFPEPCTTSASFNRTLYGEVGALIGMEGRAMSNLGHAGLTYWTPNINIYRDPRWGRGQETPGEDPYVNSVYAEKFVRGFQNSSVDPTRLQASACCKHFAGYSMEKSDGTDRHHFNAVINEYDLNHTYLPAFEACVHQDGGAASGMMCSYNAVNGVPSCANAPFMTGLARDTWGFDGYITSDCGAVEDIWKSHHYAANASEMIHDALGAGTDTDCSPIPFGPGPVQLGLTAAVKSGAVKPSTVKRALSNLFRVQMRLGYFDPIASQPLKKLGLRDINTKKAQDAALQAAREGIVMLNYNTSYLPFDRSKAGQRVAVLGPNANSTSVMLGNYFGDPPYVVTAVEGIQRYTNEVSYLGVMSGVTDMSTKDYDEACELIRSHDTAVLVIGNDQWVESEGHDRTSIKLPGNQPLFVRRMAECAAGVNKLITVVVMSGGSVDYSEIKGLPGLGGLLWAGYPGQSGGQALADILYGTVSPSGRLPHTVYHADYVDQVSMVDMQMTPNATTGNPGRTYRYYTGEPVYPWAWGLTYTNWSLVVIHASREVAYGTTGVKPVQRGPGALPLYLQRVSSISVNITNEGPRAAAFSMLFKVTPLPMGPDIGGQLADFQKVFLEVGESQVVTLGVHAHAVHHRLSSKPTKFQWEIVDLARGEATWFEKE